MTQFVISFFDFARNKALICSSAVASRVLLYIVTIRMNQEFPYQHIVFGGGGFAATVYIGVIRYLQQEGYDKSITHIAGTSMGSVFAVLLALGVSMGTFETALKAKLKENTQLLHIDLNWISWAKTSGFVHPKEWVTLILCDIVNPTMTFLELAKTTGKNVVIIATQLSTGKPMHFSVDTTPNVVVVDAIAASCALPMMCVPMKIGNELYTDGGVTANVPISAFPNVATNKVLLVQIFGVRRNTVVSNEGPDALSMMLFVLVTMFNNINLKFMIANTYANITFQKCPLEVLPISSYTSEKIILGVTDDQIDASIAVGYYRAIEFVKSLSTKH